MQEPIAAITGILVLATLSEALVEYLFAPFLDDVDDTDIIPPDEKAGIEWRPMILRYLSAFIGIALCVVYEADLMTLFGLVAPWPWIGYVVTGILIGRGSNFVHDFASRWLTYQHTE